MEPIRQAVVVGLEEETQVAVARRAAGGLCRRLGLSEEATGRAELVIVELAQNILRYAGHGQLCVGSTVDGSALQVVAIDRGPGIGNVQRVFDDGYSTGTTPGLGLGAVRRMTQQVDLYSRPGGGTVVSATIGEESGGGFEQRMAVVSTCIEGETLNGDSWTIHKAGGPAAGRELYMVVDGLGHGLYASEAAAMGVAIVRKAFEEDSQIDLPVLLDRMHGPMRATRGAAVSFVAVAGGVASCCGVGNVSTLLHSPDGTTRTVLSHNGTVGHQMRKVQEFRYPVSEGTLLVMHSDGVATRWRLSQYEGLAPCAPGTIAGVIYRDALRGRDDATVLVSRLSLPRRG